MITALLAGSGGTVVVPDAVDVIPGETDEVVNFVDSEGKVLVVFKRADVSVYLRDGANLPVDGKE